MTRVRLLAAATALVLSFHWPARAHADGLDGLKTLSDAELSEQRGGFRFGGMDISFGADIRTYIDGELALQTLINWTNEGASTSTFVSGVLTPASADQLRNGVLSTGSITMRVGDNTVYLANGGQTALLQRTDNGIQNILVNTASHITLTQDVTATLTLDGYDSFRSQVDAQRMADTLSGMIANSGSFDF